MKTLATLLVKVLVKRFYVMNAGFFLFMFFFFFGMVNGAQLISYHRSLITAMITSPVFMAVVWVGWLLYNFKCILFCTNTIKAPDSGYIYTLKALPPAKQWMLYLQVAALQYLPVLGYSAVVVYLAIVSHHLMTAMLVAAYQLLMVVFAARSLFITINNSSIAPVFAKIIAIASANFKVKLGYNGFVLGNILHERKLAFTVVKIFSIMLMSVSFLINGDHFDDDLFSIFFQLIFAGHAILVFYCVDFSESRLQFSRNLPLPLYKVAGMYLLTYCILLLPEAAFMLINNHGNLPVTHILLLYGTAICTLFLYTAVLYGCGLNMESYMLMVFVIFIVTFFLQKTGMQLLTMLGVLLTAIVVLKGNYYSFERE